MYSVLVAFLSVLVVSIHVSEEQVAAGLNPPDLWKRKGGGGSGGRGGSGSGSGRGGGSR
jgi:hypothetical protein